MTMKPSFYPDQAGEFKFIGGPHDGKTMPVDLADIEYRDGPFTYRLSVQDAPGETPPVLYVFVAEKILNQARAALMVANAEREE